MSAEYKEYGWKDSEPVHMNARLWPCVLRLAAATEGRNGRQEGGKVKGGKVEDVTKGVKGKELSVARGCEDGLRGKKVLDVGCGNGFMCGKFLKLGCDVTGIDLSEQGIAQARLAHPKGRFELIAADDHLSERFGDEQFDIVISTEVVEHLYNPRGWARACFAVLKPGGRFVCSTPYHGYLKNLAISLAGNWDTHASPLWDGGHIKLWSKQTLFALLQEAGFRDLEFLGMGRVPCLWMTMVIAAERPKVAGD